MTKSLLLIFAVAGLGGAAFSLQTTEAASTCCGPDNARRCSPTGTCTACSDCSHCGHCKAGGTCSVCKPKKGK